MILQLTFKNNDTFELDTSTIVSILHEFSTQRKIIEFTNGKTHTYSSRQNHPNALTDESFAKLSIVPVE